MHQDGSVALPPRVRHRYTGDIDEHALCVEGWHMQYDQLSSGRFQGELSDLWLDDLSLLRDRSNQAMLKSGEAQGDTLTFSLPMRDAGALHCGGHTLHEAQLLVARGDNLPELRTPANLDLLCINLQEAEMARLLACQHSALDVRDLSGCYRLPTGCAHGELAALAHELFAPEAEIQTWLVHPRARAALRDTVLMHLLDLLDTSEPHELAPSARLRMVRRAREYALAHPDQPPSILELCNRVGASRRKLQYCFQETLGINPVAYLRTLRLNAAHRALRRGEGESVQDVAAQWGFCHLSRFARDYQALFGQLPSATLKEAAQRLPRRNAESG
ncbi:AraC family transcriptional regulator [Pseudomonas oryzihabitans]|uniref:AraC family transcriptional regulator n=1 Tax=Pseudomonas oryzihabitans TaxID=47885 RepID=A0A0U4VPN1_9PSED|nr:helix-turn-helix domain-containing protein [Pseudomonas oryzihabitans]ALZ85115.1 AraC family transcriptional regulator [Pseudomonas oryzihabitans]